MSPNRSVAMLAGAVLTAVALTGCNPAADQGGSGAQASGDLCPTAETTGTIKLGMPSPLNVFAPVLLAKQTGAFEAAGIDLEITRVPSSDSLPLVAQGRLDGQLTSLSVGHFNVVDAGVEMRWVMPFDRQQKLPPGTPIPGFWSRTDVVGSAQNPDLGALRGSMVSTPTGGTGISGLILDNALSKAGLGVGDVQLKSLGGADGLAALENGAVSAAWISSPLEVDAARNPDLVPIAGYAPGVTGTALMAGRGLLDKPQLMVRFLQVVQDVTKQYLVGDYRKDPETVDLLAAAEETSPEIVRKSALLTFDPTYSLDGADRFAADLQEFSMRTGALDYSDPIPSEEIVDPRFVKALATCGPPAA